MMCSVLDALSYQTHTPRARGPPPPGVLINQGVHWFRRDRDSGWFFCSWNHDRRL